MDVVIKKGCRKVEGRYDKIKDIKLDKKGYFLIKIEDKKIMAGHCKSNNEIDYVFVGSKAQDVYKEIIKRKLVSLEHAAYLGKELVKAEICMKEGKKYIQDEDIKWKQGSKKKKK